MISPLMYYIIEEKSCIIPVFKYWIGCMATFLFLQLIVFLIVKKIHYLSCDTNLLVVH